MNEIMKIRNLSKIYGKKEVRTTVLNNLSLDIEEGDFIAVMGPSGAGSTIDKPTQGSIILDGQELTAIRNEKLAKLRKEHIGFIFQDYNLLDNMTLMDNIALPLSLSNEKAKNIQQRVQEMAGLFHLEGHLEKYPHQLSGGQKQRGAAARALIRNPRIVFADEPTGALDSKSSRELLCSLKEINEERNATILMVTHDAFSASYARKVFILKDGEIFTTLHADAERSVFYERILQLLASMGGD